MMNTLLTLLLSLQLALPLPPANAARSLPFSPADERHSQQMWWGLIDPELALWFARVPGETEETILWDWSWQGFFAALFPQSLMKEADHAPLV